MKVKDSKMAILLGSSTHIEYLLRDALKKENLNFEEQYRINTGGTFSETKYVADFYLNYNGVRLLVECDGKCYHTGSDARKKQKQRDDWLKQKHFVVLHFTTRDLELNMYGVIQTIKHSLKIPADIQSVISQNIKVSNSQQYKDNNVEVFLFCHYIQTPSGICVVYKYKHIPTDKWGAERKKICYNVPENMLETVAFYLALIDLKRPTSIKIFYNGYLYNDNYNASLKFRKNIGLLKNGEELRKSNKIYTKYIFQNENSRCSRKEIARTLWELRSRCTQAANGHLEFDTSEKYDYNEI